MNGSGNISMHGHSNSACIGMVTVHEYLCFSYCKYKYMSDKENLLLFFQKTTKGADAQKKGKAVENSLKTFYKEFKKVQVSFINK